MDFSSLFGILFSCLIMVVESGLNYQAEKNFCEKETAKLECKGDNVIIITEARYGRMAATRCIDRDYGYVGCNDSVIDTVDRMCSGRRSCEFPIPTPGLDAQSCPRDLKPYLHVKYTCQKITVVPKHACGRMAGAKLTSDSGMLSGYIANVVTEETSIGDTDCPWIIEAKPGQTLNISIMDFARNDFSHGVCNAYATLRERANINSKTICDGHERQRTAYKTTGNSLEIRILTNKKDKYFLLKYEAIGCPDIQSANGLTASRNGDKVSLDCSVDKKSWSMHCEGNEWKGKWHNCTSVSMGAVSQANDNWGIVALPFGWSIVVIIIIALTIGIIFMVVGLACLRTKKRPPSCQNNKEIPYYTGFLSTQEMDAHNRGNTKRDIVMRPSDEGIYMDENEYEYISDLTPPPPPPITTDYTQQAPVDNGKFPDPPKFFVLDPTARDFVPSNACDTLPHPSRYVRMSCGAGHQMMVAPHSHNVPSRSTQGIQNNKNSKNQDRNVTRHPSSNRDPHTSNENHLSI